MTLCWICGQQEGTTGEHRSKRSDLKEVFGVGGKLYLHTDERLNKIIQSIDSKHAKSKAPMCDTCNNSRTQPHDKSWEILSNYLRTKTPAMQPGDIIRGNRVFPQFTAQYMLGVHLFFVKWLGCQIVETSIPIKPGIDTFAATIMAGKSHKNIWLSFGCARGGWVGASKVGAAALTGGDSFDYLARFYCVDKLAVRVRFSTIKLPDDWHPDLSNRLVIQDFRYLSDEAP
jgi:hypothetical protein